MTRNIVAPNDTIVALASGPGIAAVAVIRVSGPGTRDALEALCGGVPPPRHAALRDIGPSRREARSRPRAVVPGAGKLHRRGHGRAPAAWQPRRDPRRARCAAHPAPAPASPSLASSRGVRSRTASSISPRSRASPIWSMPRPRRSGVKRWRSRKARCGISTKAGARSCSARRRLIEAGLDFADEGDVAIDVSVKAGAVVDRLR